MTEIEMWQIFHSIQNSLSEALTQIEELRADTAPDDPRVAAIMAHIDGIENSITAAGGQMPVLSEGLMDAAMAAYFLKAQRDKLAAAYDDLLRRYYTRNPKQPPPSDK